MESKTRPGGSGIVVLEIDEEKWMVESKTCGGGSGFVTLMSERFSNDENIPYRLAYMQVLREIPPQPVWAGGGTPMDAGGGGTYRFHEVWNEPVWRKMAEDIGASPWEALVKGLADGSITMRKIVKIPSGLVRARRYDTKTATVEAVDENDCVMLFALPKEIIITGHLANSVLEDGPPPKYRPAEVAVERGEKPIRAYVVKVDDRPVARIPGEEKLAEYLKTVVLKEGQVISVTS